MDPNLKNMYNRVILGSNEGPFSPDDYVDMGHLETIGQIHISTAHLPPPYIPVREPYRMQVVSLGR